MQVCQRWGLDFAHDQFVSGWSLRMLTIINDYTCEWLSHEGQVSLRHKKAAQSFCAAFDIILVSLRTRNAHRCGR